MTSNTANRLPRMIVSGLVLWLCATGAVAQFEQYTPPGIFEENRETMEERLERAIEEARWRWGQVYMHPWLGLRNLSFVDPVTDRTGSEVSDFTASIGAGLRAYAPIGRELTLAVHALPEYVWWQDLSERSQLNGRYGAGLFGNLGRTGLEITATRADEERYVSREIEELINTRDELARLALEVDIERGMSVFFDGSLRELRFEDEEEEILLGLGTLERDEEVLRAGVRFLLGKGLTLGLGVESSTVEFTQNSDRDHSGTSPILQLDGEGPRSTFSLQLAFRDLEAESTSRFPTYDEPTGSLRYTREVGGSTEIQVFGNRNLVYSANDQWAYFEDTGFGLGLRMALTSELSFRVYAEQGDNAYTSFVPTANERDDDFIAFGGQLQIKLGRILWSVGASSADYESNIPGFDRTTTTIRSSVVLGSGSGSPWG